MTQAGSGPVWATFDNFDMARRGFGAFRRSETAMGRTQVHIQTAANDWYLNEDLDAALASLRPAPGRALGISMGAFGALLFAAALGTEEAILVSPRFPAPLGWPKRAKVYATNPPPGWEARLRAATIALPAGLVLYDPHHKDDRAATLWLTGLNPRLRVLAVPFADHPATRLFREAQSWGPLQRHLLETALPELPAAIATLRRQVRTRSVTYRNRLG